MIESQTNNTHNLIKRTAKDSLLYLPSMIIPAVVGVILIRIFTTIFTKAEYGYYNVALSTIGLIKVFSVMWLSTSSIRFFLKNKENNNLIQFNSSLWICTTFSAVFTIFLSLIILEFVIKHQVNNQLFDILRLAVAASFFITYFEVYVVLYRANFQAKQYSVLWVLYVLGKPLIGLALIFTTKMRVDAIFVGFLLTPVLLFGFIIINLKLFKHIHIKDFSLFAARKFASFGLPLGLSYLSFWVLSLSDRYLIEMYRGSGEVGIYSVGYSISEKILTFSFMVIMLAAYPIIVESYEKTGKHSAQILISHLTRYYFIFITPLWIALVAMPKEILLLFADAKFISGARVLPLIASGVYILGITHYILKGYELSQRSNLVAVIALVAGLVNIGTNLILIPKIGYMGAGYACLMGYLSYFLLSVLVSRSFFAWIVPYKSILSVFLIASMEIYFLHTISQIVESTLLKLFLFLPISFASFFFLLTLIGEIKIEEYSRSLSFIRGILK